jgi:hypothetical protein
VVRFALGSSADLTETRFRAVRSADTSFPRRGARVRALRFELSAPDGRKTALMLDAEGWPLGFDVEAFGATVEARRVD